VSRYRDVHRFVACLDTEMYIDLLRV